MHAVSADAVRLSVFVGVCRGLVGVCRRVSLRLLAGAFGTTAVELARCVIGQLVEAVAQPTVQTAAAAKAEAWSGPANGVQGSVTPMPRNAPDRAAANTPRHRSHCRSMIDACIRRVRLRGTSARPVWRRCSTSIRHPAAMHSRGTGMRRARRIRNAL